MASAQTNTATATTFTATSPPVQKTSSESGSISFKPTTMTQPNLSAQPTQPYNTASTTNTATKKRVLNTYSSEELLLQAASSLQGLEGKLLYTLYQSVINSCYVKCFASQAMVVRQGICRKSSLFTFLHASFLQLHSMLALKTYIFFSAKL